MEREKVSFPLEDYNLARVDGFEPSHNGVKVRCRNHLATPSLAPEAGLEPTTL